MNNELIQYYVVNKDLNMSPGKVAAQIAHASMVAVMKYRYNDSFLDWAAGDMKKIILKGAEKELLKFKDAGYISIIDKGYTEVPPNSLTVVVLPVMTKEEAKIYVKRLQTYKG